MRVLMLLLLVFSVTVSAAPRVKTVTLERHTALVVFIPPASLGVRFLFPFVLDEQDDYVPFSSQITNKVFNYKRVDHSNLFVITVPDVLPTDRTQHVGNLFVTVAGYQITVELRTSNDLSQHYSDIDFQLGTGERENLIQKGIAQRTASLEADYKKKLDDLDKQADLKSIARVGVLALKKPSTTRIKEETKLVLTNGDEITLYVDESINYGVYTSFVFELDTDGKTNLSIIDAKLFALSPDTQTPRPIESARDMPQRLIAGEAARGVLTTLDQSLNAKEMLKLQVLTDKGTLEASW